MSHNKFIAGQKRSSWNVSPVITDNVVWNEQRPAAVPVSLLKIFVWQVLAVSERKMKLHRMISSLAWRFQTCECNSAFMVTWLQVLTIKMAME